MKTVVAAAIISERACLIGQRAASKHDALKWEFPGGTVEENESLKEALIREIQEELGVDIQVGKELGRSNTKAIELVLFEAQILHGTPAAKDHETLIWATDQDLSDRDWALADIPLIPNVIALLRHD